MTANAIRPPRRPRAWHPRLSLAGPEIRADRPHLAGHRTS